MKKGSSLAQISLVVVVIIILIPVIYMIIFSLTPASKLFVKIIPDKFTFQNYITAYKAISMRYYLNTWIIGLSTATVTLILASFAGYGLSRFDFKSKKILIVFILVTQMLPLELLVISYFFIIKSLGLYNTYFALILMDTTLTLPFATLMLKSVFDSVPKEVEESAKVDGCSTIASFYRIVIPISRSGLFAAFVFSFIVSYGELLFALTFTQDERAMPMTVMLANLLSHHYFQWEKMVSLAIIFSIPIFIIFASVQESFIRGLTSGSLKDV